MGLDSVELLMDVENYFGIRMPNKEAETVDTIQNMVDMVAHHLNVVDSSMLLQRQVFLRMEQAFNNAHLSHDAMKLSDTIGPSIASSSQEQWAVFEQFLQLEIPKPAELPKSASKWAGKLKSFLFSPAYDSETITISQFVDAICACNYEQLIDRAYIKSKYEIYIAVMAITVHKTGVDYYEITPAKSFTNDLDVD